MSKTPHCHSREGGNPISRKYLWIPDHGSTSLTTGVGDDRGGLEIGSSKILIIVAVCIMIVVPIFVLAHREWQAKLVSPGFSLERVQKPSPSPEPSPTPKTFKFNESTNLNQEAESVNPQVEDSDFIELQSVIGAI